MDTLPPLQAARDALVQARCAVNNLAYLLRDRTPYHLACAVVLTHLDTALRCVQEAAQECAHITHVWRIQVDGVDPGGKWVCVHCQAEQALTLDELDRSL